MLLTTNMKGVIRMGSEYVKFCPVCNETRQNMEWCDDEKLKEFSKGYHNVLVPKEGLTICPACKKGTLEDSVLTHDEFNLIEDVSDSDRQFLEAMIELKKNDPIEYQLKMSQFKAQVKQQEQAQVSKREEENTIHCPKCDSTAITTGARGVNNFWGLLGASKTVNRCGNCGYTWKPNNW